MTSNHQNSNTTLIEHKHHACPRGHTATVLTEDLEVIPPILALDSRGNKQYYCEHCSPPRIFTVNWDGHIVS